MQILVYTSMHTKEDTSSPCVHSFIAMYSTQYKKFKEFKTRHVMIVGVKYKAHQILFFCFLHSRISFFILYFLVQMFSIVLFF